MSHVAATATGAACSIVCWLPLHVPVASAVCAALEGKPIKHVINKITENFRKSPRCGLNKHSTKAQKEKQKQKNGRRRENPKKRSKVKREKLHDKLAGGPC